jgi:hypothetical protein
MRPAPIAIRIHFFPIAFHLPAAFAKPLGVAIESVLIGIQAITATRIIVPVGQCRTASREKYNPAQNRTQSNLQNSAMQTHETLLKE